MSTKSLQEKIFELRDLINSSICCKQGAWERKKEGDWSKLWTAMDNIEDTQSAINEYLTLTDFSKLAVYGLLQAMFVQQNAISYLEEAIQIQAPNWKEKYPELSRIRKIRNEIIGHPISDNGLYASIAYTNDPNILEYGIWRKDGFKHKTINLREVIDAQYKAFIKEVDRVMEKIKEDEFQHKQKFKGKTLLKLLSSTIYSIGKLQSSSQKRGEYLQIHFGELKSVYDDFKKEIKKRFMLNSVTEEGIQIPGLILVIQHIDEILPRIENMIFMGDSVDQIDLDVYMESLDRSFTELREMAKEIDAEFNNEYEY